MKKLVYLFVILLALSMALPLAALAGDGQIVFTDKVLEDKVRGCLGLKEGPITQAMAEEVTHLDLSNYVSEGGEVPESDKIKSIDDLEAFKNLEGLNLYANDIHDISVLAGLTKLSDLSLERNDIYDFSPLAGLTNLRILFLDGNGKDLSFLKGLVNLEIASLGYANSKLPEELKGLPKLTYVCSVWGDISDISILADMPGLTGVELTGNMVSDITPLQGLRLEKLFLSDNMIIDYSPVKDIYPSLTEKDFELVLPDDQWGERSADDLVFNDPVLEKKVRAAMGIPEGYITKAQAEAVTSLNLGNPFDAEVPEADKITDIAALTQFPSLVSLNLANNGFHVIKALSLLTKLTELDLRNNDIWELNPLGKLTGLQTLSVGCWGKDMSFLPALQSLTYLDMGGSEAFQQELGSLTNLVTLKAAGGQYTDISVLSKLVNLQVLDLSWNLVADLTPIKDLPLKELYLAGDPIEDYTPIKDLYKNLTNKDFMAMFPEDMPEEALVIADRNFEKALRQAMNIYDRPITKKDAYLTTSLDIYRDKEPDAGFEDISPLQYFVNLQRLSFNASNISDLTPLAKLTELTNLDIGFQQITDIGPLSGLTKLEGLGINGNRISDLTPIAGLVNLSWLNASQNQITDVSPLQNLVKLRALFLRENPVDDWAPLDGLMQRLEETDIAMVPADIPNEPLPMGDPSFEKALGDAMGIHDRPITLRDAWRTENLYLFGGDNRENAFADISPISAFVNLGKLVIDHTDVTDLTPLKGLSKLAELTVKYGILSDLTPLSGMQQLVFLELNDNQIADVTPLAGLQSLKHLNLNGNWIEDVTPLAGLGSSLGELYLGNNPVKDFSSLTNLFPQLRDKDFQVISTTDIPDEPLKITDKALKQALADAMNIHDRAITQKDAYTVTELTIQGAGIKDISPLAYFVNLGFLDASWNKIVDVTPLSGLTKLTGLNIRGNQIKDVAPLAGLKLGYADVAENQIKDISPLSELSSLTSLYVDNNPFTNISALAAIEPNLNDKDFIAAVPDSIPDEAIVFSDKNFEKAIRKLLGIPKEPITQKDAWRVTRLDFAGAKIRTAFKDISPLKYFVNLKNLSMSGNSLTDLSVFADMQSLAMLILDSQKITDVSPLKGLKSLEKLVLNKNQITDLNPLAGLTELHILEMNNNKVEDLSPIAGLTGLEELVIQGNQIADAAPLGKLGKLWKLDLRKNKLTDAGPLAGLGNLRELYLAGNKVKDYSSLKDVYGRLEQMDFQVK